MLKVLVMSLALDIGGVQKALLSLVQALKEEGCEVDLLLQNPGGCLECYLPEGLEAQSFPKAWKWTFVPKNGAIKAVISSLGPNLNVFRALKCIASGVLSHNMGAARQRLQQACMHTLPELSGEYDLAIDMAGLYKAFLAHKVKAKVKLSWVHGDYRILRRDKACDLKDYRLIDGIATVSQKCLDILYEEFPMFRDKCFIAPNITSKKGIALLADEAVEFDEGFTGRRILSITRLDLGKGLEIAAEACASLVKEGFNIRWYILGEGAERNKVEALIESLGLKEQMILLGAKLNPYPYIKRADIVAHCSLSEGKSVAIDEAKLLSKPILLTNFPTACDQIDSGQNGLICGTDPQEVSRALKQMLVDPALCEGFSQSLKDFDIDRDEALQALECATGLQIRSKPKQG